MYNYNFYNDLVNYEFLDKVILINNQEIIGNVLLTNNNLLIFQNINRGTMKFGKAVTPMADYDLIVKIDLETLKYQIDENNSIINDNIIIIDFKIDNFL